MPSLEVLLKNEGNLLARYGNVVLQVRSGEMTLDVLAKMESAALLARAASAGPVGAVAVIEEGATLASAEIRAEQARVVKRLLGDSRTHFVTVIIAETVATRAISAVMRLLLIGTPRLKSVGTIDDAVDWLVPRVGTVTPSELRRVISDARAALRERA
jgi:hypothetical protein